MSTTIDIPLPPETPDAGEAVGYFEDPSGRRWWLTIDRQAKRGVIRGEPLARPLLIEGCAVEPNSQLLHVVKLWLAIAWTAATMTELDVSQCKYPVPPPETN